MSWLRHHFAAFRAAWRHLFKAPGNFFLNVLVVSIALALPFAGLVMLENVRPVSSQLVVKPEISVFMSMDASREQADTTYPLIRKVLSDNNSQAQIVFIPREKALDSLKSKTGLEDVLATLGTNPLPDSFILSLTGFEHALDAAKVDKITNQLKTLPNVDIVQIDSAWIKRLAALLHILRLVLLFLAVSLGAVVVAVVFNTIRLQVMTQADEIEVSRLFGATNAYIHRPFYYTGALLGFFAGALALGLVVLGLGPLNEAIANFAHLYGSEFALAPPSWQITITLLAISAFLGLFGALLSVRRHLSRLS
jgi:cell division transport system permease protein